MKKWSLNAKIALILSIFTIASVLIAVIGIKGMSDLNESMKTIVTVNAVRLNDAQELQGLFFTQLINEKNYILDDTKEGMAEYQSRLDKRNEEIEKLIERSYKVSSDLGKKDLDAFKKTYESWWLTITEELKLAAAGDDKEAIRISKGKGREFRLTGEKIIDGIVARNQKLMKEESDRAEVSYGHSRTVMITTSIFSILFGIVFAFFMMRMLSRAIDQVITNLTDGSGQVTSAAQQIASSSEELSGASTEQASSLEETAASVDELNSMIQKNAENAMRTYNLAGSSKQSATRGKEVVQNMISAIDEINVSNSTIMESINESNQKISEIVTVISEIGNKTKVINDIVFQTKLLSFNASVEAARAGENGKGFAVVAEEVGNLAQMSGNAAKEITAMLDDSILRVGGIVTDTKQKVGDLILDGKSKVETGTRIAKECGLVLDEIVVNVDSVTSMAAEISNACKEQALGVQEITKAMGQLNQVTQTNSAASEEAASAAEELSAQTDSLSSVVGILVEAIKGSGTEKHLIAYAPEINKKYNASITPSRPVKENEKHSFNKILGLDQRNIPIENDPRFEEV